MNSKRSRARRSAGGRYDIGILSLNLPASVNKLNLCHRPEANPRSAERLHAVTHAFYCATKDEKTQGQGLGYFDNFQSAFHEQIYMIVLKLYREYKDYNCVNVPR